MVCNRFAGFVLPSLLVDYLQGGSWCARYGRLALISDGTGGMADPSGVPITVGLGLI